jgi:hypothetical protein
MIKKLKIRRKLIKLSMLFHKLKQMIAKVKTYNKNFMKKYASYNNLNNKIKWLIEELSFFGPFVILNCNI